MVTAKPEGRVGGRVELRPAGTPLSPGPGRGLSPRAGPDSEWGRAMGQPRGRTWFKGAGLWNSAWSLQAVPEARWEWEPSEWRRRVEAGPRGKHGTRVCGGDKGGA